MRLRNLLVVATCVLGPTASAATLHVDDFETGTSTLGWAGGGGALHIASGGPGGADDAYILVLANTHLATHNTSSSWIGNLTAIGAVSVKVDMMVPVATPQPPPLAMRLVLFGHASLPNRWTSKTAQDVPADGVWREYAFSLAESDLQEVSVVGAEPTTYAQMMAGTLQVMLRHNPGAPNSGGTTVTNGRLSLDNIELVGPAASPGDFDGDGDVDGVDLTHPTLGWKTRFGVDLEGADFLTWQRRIGLPGSSAATATVLEPSTTAMVLAILVGGAAIRSRSTRRS